MQLRERFLPSYLVQLQQLYHHKTLVAGYISAPRSRELVNLIRFELNQEDGHASELSDSDRVRHLVDVTVAHFFLKPYTRSIIFKNHAAICDYYPEHLQPYFFYLHVGDEIGRVEIPAWIALDDAYVDLIAQVILDQCAKGYGYPVALAEAHEQAVVKGPDREFFYQLISKIGIEQKKCLVPSQKSVKKRRIGF